MQPGIGDERGGTLQLGEQGGEFRFGVVEQPQFLPERSGIQTPTGHKGGRSAEPAESRQIGALLLNREL